MGTVTNGEILRVSVRMKGPNAQDIVNVFHFQAIFADSQDDEDVVAIINTWLNVSYGSIHDRLPSVMSPYDYKVDVVAWSAYKLHIVRNIGTFLWTLTAPPNGTGDYMPAGVAALLKFTTGAGKHYGRKFIGPLLEADITAGSLTAGAISTLSALATLWLDQADISVGNVLQPGIVHNLSGTFLPFLDAVVNAVAAYQRRRKPNVGS